MSPTPRRPGTRITMSDGYIGVLLHDHPRADANGYVREHLLVAEKVLGYPVPLGVEVHHVDETRNNNAATNLVICEDQSYHKLLHRRLRALRASGNASWRVCVLCAEYDAPENLATYGRRTVHRSCDSKAATIRKRLARARSRR